MKLFLSYFFIFPLIGYLTLSANDQPEIKLAGAKDRVLSTKLRISILEVAGTSLDRSDDAFLEAVDGVGNPYLNKEDASGKSAKSTDTSRLVYENASILELIQTNFATQVRGILAKGDTYYLQLDGGSLLGTGASFPVEIPEIKGQSFLVIISEITSRSYTLKMNDAVREVIFEKSSGVTKDFDN